MKLLLVLSLALLGLVQGREIGTRSYNGYQVLTAEATNLAQFEVIKTLYESDEYDFWTTPRKMGATDLMASPEQVKDLEDLFLTHGIKYEVKIKDVQRMIQNEKDSNKRSGDGRISWTAYASYAEVVEFLTGINSEVATVSTIGQSFEGRDLHVVKISSGGPPKKSLLIDANIHAREWISGATATWIINELTTNSSAYSKILEEIDIYIIPMINVDGYEWSRTRDRMWRKTRSANSGTTCVGCDPNRNFPFHFGGEGTSTNPCSDTYMGSAPLSESETKALSDFVNAKEDEGVRFIAYMTFHSYSQLWLLPWGYTAGVYPPDYDQQLSLGRAAIAALRGISGTNYETGQGADILYGVGGASDDWAKDHGIKYTSTIEMRDTGRYGFLLPADQIIPNAREVWAGLQVVIERVIGTA